MKNIICFLSGISITVLAYTLIPFKGLEKFSSGGGSYYFLDENGTNLYHEFFYRYWYRGRDRRIYRVLSKEQLPRYKIFIVPTETYDTMYVDSTIDMD